LQSGLYIIASQNLAFRGPEARGPPWPSLPGGLVGHCTSGRPLNPPVSECVMESEKVYTGKTMVANGVQPEAGGALQLPLTAKELTY